MSPQATISNLSFSQMALRLFSSVEQYNLAVIWAAVIVAWVPMVDATQTRVVRVTGTLIPFHRVVLNRRSHSQETVQGISDFPRYALYCFLRVTSVVLCSMIEGDFQRVKNMLRMTQCFTTIRKYL